jgi:hypothetical protein
LQVVVYLEHARRGNTVAEHMTHHPQVEGLSPAAAAASRPKPTGVKHLSGAPLKGRLLTLPTNIRLGWKDLTGTNALAYYKNS